MEKTERVGLSIERQLLEAFDRQIAVKGYANRSEAIRDLIRQQLSEARLEDPNARAVAAVILVYDHHVTRLSQGLLQLQHSHLLETVSSLHVHLDHHHCLEVVVLRGRVRQLYKVADRMISLRGVFLGKIHLVTLEGHASTQCPASPV
ncbi:MAG: nickel-responsive transcriptional regulator NikR [Sedimentisphaerales bacterium]|jgi:CopG family nickel-responsive transcriptional regulator|nr:nickel-responsive transcriptional regulator NikR [Sedimentisphaerales bacterium]